MCLQKMLAAAVDTIKFETTHWVTPKRTLRPPKFCLVPVWKDRAPSLDNFSTNVKATSVRSIGW